MSHEIQKQPHFQHQWKISYRFLLKFYSFDEKLPTYKSRRDTSREKNLFWTSIILKYFTLFFSGFHEIASFVFSYFHIYS